MTIGLGEAVGYFLNVGPERAWERIKLLATILRKSLQEIDGVEVHDRGIELSGIVTFSVKGTESAVIKRHINISIGGQQATPIYMENNGLQTLVRASMHYYNHSDEVTLFCEELRSIVNVPRHS